MNAWQSNPIPVNGVQIQIQANKDGVTFGKSVDGTYASDLLLSPDEARSVAYALIEGAGRVEDLS